MSQFIFHEVVTSSVSVGCGGRSKSGGAKRGSLLQFAPPQAGVGSYAGDASFAGMSVYFSLRFNLLCFCGLRMGLEIGRRIWRVVFTICVTRI
ncbi:hypothetical protein SBA4_3220007 [Candidatus Sulfopaludibacter sp. SbA4]|nr:hypothetical protein SBA4_3220007 [Candidatus Sulfopaludibacter sp. SbA4]